MAAAVLAEGWSLSGLPSRSSVRVSSSAELSRAASQSVILYSDKYLKHDTEYHPECCELHRAVLDGLIVDEDWWQGLVKLTPPVQDLAVRRFR